MSESLAGRVEILTLWPLSQGEMEGVRAGFIDMAFAEKLPNLPPSTEMRSGVVARIIRGGFPEVVCRQDEQPAEKPAQAGVEGADAAQRRRARRVGKGAVPLWITFYSKVAR